MNSVKSTNNSATIAFTLPISCQICLGKVKQPVVCPNQHVFCGQCMELWLNRSNQCPACRVVISRETPCRPVLGGLTIQSPEKAGEGENTKELRRTRMELIYKEYETEIDRLEADLTVAREENKRLNRHLTNQGTDPAQPGSSQPPTPLINSDTDRQALSLLNNKLKDASALYDKVKADLNKYRQENAALKEKNDNLSRENSSLKMELANRSPRRYGRYTLVTLEAKVEMSDRQIKKLQTALEKSDGYIEELEAKISHYQQMSHRPRASPNEPDTRDKRRRKDDLGFLKPDEDNFDDSDLPSQVTVTSECLNDSELPSRISNASDIERDVMSDVAFDSSDFGGNKGLSFDLEMPSPMGDSESRMQDNDLSKESRFIDDSFVLPKPSSSNKCDPTLDSCKKKLKFTTTSTNPRRDSKSEKKKVDPRPSVRFSLDVKEQHQPDSTNDWVTSKKSSWAPRNKDESDLDISMTAELEDCMRIMDEAKRNLEERHLSPKQLTTTTAPHTITSASTSGIHIPSLMTASGVDPSQHSGLLAKYPRSESILNKDGSRVESSGAVDPGLMSFAGLKQSGLVSRKPVLATSQMHQTFSSSIPAVHSDGLTLSQLRGPVSSSGSQRLTLQPDRNPQANFGTKTPTSAMFPSSSQTLESGLSQPNFYSQPRMSSALSQSAIPDSSSLPGFSVMSGQPTLSQQSLLLGGSMNLPTTSGVRAAMGQSVYVPKFAQSQ